MTKYTRIPQSRMNEDYPDRRDQRFPCLWHSPSGYMFTILKTDGMWSRGTGIRSSCEAPTHEAELRRFLDAMLAPGVAAVELPSEIMIK